MHYSQYLGDSQFVFYCIDTVSLQVKNIEKKLKVHSVTHKSCPVSRPDGLDQKLILIRQQKTIILRT
jgi:hypothetical protein